MARGKTERLSLRGGRSPTWQSVLLFADSWFERGKKEADCHEVVRTGSQPIVGADIIRPSFASLRFFGRIISAPTDYDGCYHA